MLSDLTFEDFAHAFSGNTGKYSAFHRHHGKTNGFLLSSMFVIQGELLYVEFNRHLGENLCLILPFGVILPVKERLLSA